MDITEYHPISHEYHDDITEYHQISHVYQRISLKYQTISTTITEYHLAYVVRVDNRSSIAYDAAPARSVRHGVVSPEVLMRSLSSQCHASRIKKIFGVRRAPST